MIQSLCVWNGFLLGVVGVLFLIFGDRPSGEIVAGTAFAAGIGLFALGRRVARGTGWRYDP